MRRDDGMNESTTDSPKLALGAIVANLSPEGALARYPGTVTTRD
jgi:hypothetical protein